MSSPILVITSFSSIVSTDRGVDYKRECQPKGFSRNFTCGTVVLEGWSRSSTAERFVVDSQMLIRCSKCRAYNVVPTARLAEEPREALAMVHNRLKGLYMRSSSAGAAAEYHFGTAPTATTRLAASS
jgi:hypothetical protein